MKLELEPLSNNYREQIDEKAAKQNALKGMMRKRVQSMKETAAQLQLGDDAKAVDEAVLVTFLATLFENVHAAWNRYQELGLDYRYAQEENGVKLEGKLDAFDRFRKHPELLSDFTRLSVMKHAIEKVSSGNSSESACQLDEVNKGIAEIADFYGYSNEQHFQKALEEAEIKFYGEGGASVFKKLRDLSHGADTIDKLSGDTVTLDAFISDRDTAIQLINQIKIDVTEKFSQEEIERLAADGQRIMATNQHQDLV